MSKKFITSLITYVLWFFVAIVCFVLLLPLACLPVFRYDNRLYFFISSIVGRLTLVLAFVRIKIYGWENIPAYPNNPAIFVANHTSALDIALLEIITASYPHVWISKEEYLKVPLFGFLLERMHVTVNRENEALAGRAFVKALQLVKDKPRHLLLFPEGTRHSDGKVHEFNAGFALLAKKLNRPVIPVVITGAYAVFSPKSFLIDSSAGPIKISIGNPMVCADQESVNEFAQRVHTYFQATLKDLKK